LTKRLRDKVGLFLYLFCGLFGTIGGWWMMLSMFGLAPPFLEQFSILNLFIGFCTIVTLWVALLLAGPSIIYDTVTDYRKNKEGA